MALNYHCFWYLFHMLFKHFIWLVLDSNLVNIIDFMLSKFKYLIGTELKLLSLLLQSIVQGFLSCWTSCTTVIAHGDFWHCLCFCVLLQIALKWFIFPHPLHLLPYAGNSLCGCPVWQYLQFSTDFFSFIHCSSTAYYDMVFASLFLLNQLLFNL